MGSCGRGSPYSFGYTRRVGRLKPGAVQQIVTGLTLSSIRSKAYSIASCPRCLLRSILAGNHSLAIENRQS